MTRLLLVVAALAGIAAGQAAAQPGVPVLPAVSDLSVTCRAVVDVHARRDDPDWVADLGNARLERGLIRLSVSYGHCIGYLESALHEFAAATRQDGSPYFCLPAWAGPVHVAHAFVVEYERLRSIAAVDNGDGMAMSPRLAVFLALAPYECRGTQ